MASARGRTVAPPGLRMESLGSVRPGVFAPTRGFHPWLLTAAPPGLRRKPVEDGCPSGASEEINRLRFSSTRGFHPWLLTAAPPGLRWRTRRGACMKGAESPDPHEGNERLR